MHVASTLGQLDGIPLEGVKAYIAGAKSVQELVDMPYPAEELTKVFTRTLARPAVCWRPRLWRFRLLQRVWGSGSPISTAGQLIKEQGSHSLRQMC